MLLYAWGCIRVPLSYLLYEEKADMPEVEQIRKILEGRERREKEFLLHMLHEMAKAMNNL